MPNRYAGPEDFSDSRALAKVSLDALAFYASIFFTVDDFGRMVSDPAMLKARAFPYRQEIRGTDCSRWLAECERAGLLVSYEVDGTPYLQLTAFSGPRFRRATKSKYPEPPADASNCARMRAVASNCVQLRADASNCPVPGTDYGTDYGTDTPLPPTGGVLFEVPKVDSRKRGRTKAPELYGDPLFVEFWNGYPHKIAKGQAWTTWLKMAPADREAAAEKSPLYGQAYANADDERRRFIPHPSTWLNDRRYEDDPSTWKAKAGGGTAQPPARRLPEVGTASPFASGGPFAPWTPEDSERLRRRDE